MYMCVYVCERERACADKSETRREGERERERERKRERERGTGRGDGVAFYVCVRVHVLHACERERACTGRSETRREVK